MRALEWVFLLSPFLFGLYFPWTSALLSTALIVLLLIINREMRLSRSPVFLTAASLVLLLLLGGLWGCDRGMAAIGAAAFLPLPLFVLAIEQYPVEQRTMLFRRLPAVACVMVLSALVLSFLKTEEGWFLVSGRQAGFFQYPNTYALYLLCALGILLFGEAPKGGTAALAGILILGIILSGSRTVFLLLFFLLLFYFCIEKNAKKRREMLALVAMLAIGLVLIVLLTGDRKSIGRFLTISLSSSEMLGRLLYARDALPVIARHPFGLGYTGYACLQGSFQSGVYSVRYVHNELLQLLLDVGWIPAGFFLWALLRFFRHDGRNLRNSPCFTSGFRHAVYIDGNAAATSHGYRTAGFDFGQSPTVICGYSALFRRALWLDRPCIVEILHAGLPDSGSDLSCLHSRLDRAASSNIGR